MTTVKPYSPFKFIFLIFGSLFFIVSFGTAFATVKDVDFLHNQAYKACMQLTQKDPEEAFETGLNWQDHGGGLPARHCTAIALFELGQFVEAAKRLEALAQEMPDTISPMIVSEILGQAGLALSLEGEITHALEVQTAALRLFKDNINVLIDRALSYIDLGKLKEALKDLDAVLLLDVDHVEAMVYRGASHRQLKHFDKALVDLNRALSLMPTHPEGLLERGIVYRLQDKKDLARADWLKLIEYHDGRPVSDVAQRNLQKMELKN